VSAWQVAPGAEVDLLGCGDPLLQWLPDDTLFSLASRHHRYWGYSGWWQTAQLLFGGRRAGTQHDFPCALDEFARRTSGCFGSAEQIARERTLLRFYRPFNEAGDVQAAVESMRGPSVAHLKFRLGLLTSRFRANHPLKACAECMREDLADSGWVYWHMQHQYPGVWVCPRHERPLLTATVKSTGVERFLWHLPNADRLTGEWSLRLDESAAGLLRLARLTTSLVDRDDVDGWLDAPDVREILRLQLGRRGWLTATGNARLTEAAADYLRHCRPLRVVPEFSGLPSSLDEAKAQLGRLIRPLRAGVHPLRLLIAIDWLFDSAADFVAMRGQARETLGADQSGGTASNEPADSGRTDQRRPRLLSLLQSGRSASSAAAQVGIDVATAMAWAAAAGIQVGRRPKFLKADVRRKLIGDLRKGADKQEAAARHGVSVHTITRVLRTEVGLHEAWKTARTERARSLARRAWLRLLKSHRGAGAKLMREMEPAAFAWLYRNDRAWLAQNTPPRQRHAPRGSSVRWDERDEQLSRAVQQAALQLSRERPAKPLRLWQIYQVLPELKPKLRALERLPLTRRALERALDRAPRSRGSSDLFD
jgi:hypothetical protein